MNFMSRLDSIAARVKILWQSEVPSGRASS
jgi:hypothetical protein